MSEPEDFLLKEILADIIKGYSTVYDNSGIFYIKHLNLIDSSNIDVYKNSLLKEAISSKNLKKEADLEMAMEKSGNWTKRVELENLKKEIKTLAENIKKQVYRGAQIKMADEEYERKTKQLAALNQEKSSILGITAEIYVQKKIDELYIIHSLYNDPKLNDPKYTLESFTALEEEEVSSLIKIYNEKMSNFNTLNFKKIALMSNFSHLYYLCNDDPFIFYGKSLIALTFYQAEIFGYGRYFKGMFTSIGNPPPDDIKNDPEELEAWYEAAVHAKNIEMKNKNAAGSGMKSNGAKVSMKQSNDLGVLAKAKGGSASMEDILRAQGVNIK